MRHLARIISVLTLAVVATSFVNVRATGGEARGPRVTVVAELFTSEGCSSCPSADDLLKALIETQPVEGVEVLGLSSHVDYWDRLGWRDPFSSPFFSARQSTYGADVFRSDGNYTPQLVVDGSLEAIGSDKGAVRKILLEAAKRPKATVTVTVAGETDRMAQVDVRIDVPEALAGHGAADIVVAVAEDGLVTHVKRGENNGRTLSHAGVVRSLTTVGRIEAGARTATAHASLTLAPDWKPGSLRFVAFVQDMASHRIFGAGSSALSQGR